MTHLNVLLNVSHELTEADCALVRCACPDSQFYSAPRELNEQPDQLDGRHTNVLVTELVPRNLNEWPNLKLVQLVSAGIDHLGGHPIWQSDIPVATASGLYSVPIAQFATAAVLSLAHRLRDITQFTSTRQWPNRDSLAGAIVRGRTVGILGYGGIGRECARQLSALGMRIVCMTRSGNRSFDDHFLAWAGTGDPQGQIPEQWFTPDRLHEMLPMCDVLLVTAPRTRDTKALIGADQLALLPSQSHVIALSRGGIVDESALAQSLHSGHVGAAWVDAYLEEPPPATHPLFAAPNITLTPHMSGVYGEYWSIFPRLLAENVRRLSIRQPLLNIAHGERGY